MTLITFLLIVGALTVGALIGVIGVFCVILKLASGSWF